MGNIILIGFMGSGKTAVGEKLAAGLGWHFIDTDARIEEEQGMAVAEIFAARGEGYFRALESDCLRALVQAGTDETVIATGGGMPLDGENRRLLSGLGMVVYLRVTAETVSSRIGDFSLRPLLDGADPAQKIAALLGGREAIYEAAADVSVDTVSLTAAQVVSAVLEEIT